LPFLILLHTPKEQEVRKGVFMIVTAFCHKGMPMFHGFPTC